MNKCKNLKCDDYRLKNKNGCAFKNSPPENCWGFVSDETEHLGCASYPNCDLAPIGCEIVMGEKMEPFGYKGYK